MKNQPFAIICHPCCGYFHSTVLQVQIDPNIYIAVFSRIVLEEGIQELRVRCYIHEQSDRTVVEKKTLNNSC